MENIYIPQKKEHKTLNIVLVFMFQQCLVSKHTHGRAVNKTKRKYFYNIVHVYMSQQVLANKHNRLRDLRLSLVRLSEYSRAEVCASGHDNEKN